MSARRLAVLLAPAAWAALIFALSSLPGSRVPLKRRWDKAAHAVEYAVLGWLLRGSLREAGLGASAATVLAWAGAAGYGVLDEVHQSFVPHRSPDAADAVADALGAALGAGAHHRASDGSRARVPAE